MNILLCTQCDRTLCSLYTLAFKGYLDKGWELLQGQAWQEMLFWAIASEIKGTCALARTCVRSLLTRAKEDKERRSLFSPEARGSGWFWGCASEPSWCFSPSCWTAQREAGTARDPTPFCGKKRVQSASSVRPHFQNVERLFLFLICSCRRSSKFKLKLAYVVVKTRMQTYWMYLSETFWLCLVVMVRMYICRAASRSAASYFSSGPNRSKTTSLQLCEQIRERCYVIIPESVSGFFEEHFISPLSNSPSSASPPTVELKNKLFEIPSKGYGLQSPMSDSEAENGELWQEVMISFPPPGLFHLTNYQRHPIGK